MTAQSPRIYIYKIIFEEVLYYYYGVHKEKKFNEYYMGSPETHKWMWNFYTPKKQILQLFNFTDEGWLEALDIEERLIRPVFNTDKWCLNEACGGKFSIDVSRKNGQKTGKKMYEEKRGLFALTPEERSEIGRKTFEKAIGCFSVPPEERTKLSSKVGKRNCELGIGVAGRSKEKMTEDGKKGGTKTKELGVGIFALTKEERKIISSNGGKIGGKTTGTQRWMCLETGYITTPGPLSIYQKKQGIDTSKRVRVS